MPLHVSNTCAHHQEVKIALHSLWYHHTYRCDDTIKLIVNLQTTIAMPVLMLSTSEKYYPHADKFVR